MIPWSIPEPLIHWAVLLADNISFQPSVEPLIHQAVLLVDNIPWWLSFQLSVESASDVKLFLLLRHFAHLPFVFACKAGFTPFVPTLFFL
jgi:hypothetical protein